MDVPRFEDVPDRFYKYRPLGSHDSQLEWLRQSIVENGFYCPAPTEFNDPFDCVPCYRAPTEEGLRAMATRVIKNENPRATDSELRQLVAERLKNPPDLSPALVKAAMLTALSQSSVFSMSVRPDDVLMWSYYSNSHKGVCLILDGKALVKQFWTVYPVVYSADRPILHVGDDEPLAAMEKLLVTKSNAWQHEGEWRYVEWRKGAGIRKFSPATLKGLILGSSISPDHRQAIIDWTRERSESLEIYQATCDEEHFRINLVELQLR